MKTRSFSFKIMVLYLLCFSSVLLAQSYPHNPVSHTHSNKNCWSYATVRAFQEEGGTHAGCDPDDAGGITSLSGDPYFTRYDWNINNVQAGDIIEFKEEGEDHAAFVTNKYGGLNPTKVRKPPLPQFMRLSLHGHYRATPYLRQTDAQ